MMGCQTEDILNDIASRIISCDNTVTYKWISQKWNVHVNTAKQLLYSFLNKEKSKENPVNFEVIYFVSGPLKACGNEKSYQVCLVREKDLPDVKSKLEKVISEHVYSVQKGNLKDLHALYVVDKADGNSVLLGKSGKGAIKNEEAIPRSFGSLLKSSASSKQLANDKEDKTKQKDDKSFVKNTPNSSIVGDDNLKTLKDPKSKEELIVNGKTKKDDHKGIAGMFAAQSGKNSDKKCEKEVESTNTVSKKPEAKKNGIATFFAKQAERPPVQKVKKEEPQKRAELPKKVETKKKQATGKKIPPTKKSEQEVIEEDDEDPFASEDEEIDRRDFLIQETVSDEDRCESAVKQKGKGKATKKKPATNDRKKKRPTSFEGEEESPLATKKRRRIKMISSSEDSSDEEKEIGESESPIPQSPKAPLKEEISDDDDIIPATPQESQSGPPKKRMRRRVLVNKTFSDEQGFIVTKKEYAFESCTDDSSRSGDEAKSSKEKDLLNGKLNHAKETKDGDNEPNNNKNKDNDVEMTSPGDSDKDSKGKKGKVPAKGKKTANKKISPSNVRQGVLTSFFKRS